MSPPARLGPSYPSDGLSKANRAQVSPRSRLFEDRSNERTWQILKLSFILVAANVRPARVGFALD